MYCENKSYVAVRRSFLKLHGYLAKNLPCILTLRHIVKKFERIFTITSQRKGKKSRREVKRIERLYKNA